MKKFLTLSVFSMLLLSAQVQAKMSYECSRYLNGEWQGYVKVAADNNAEAVRLAEQKYRQMEYRFDYVKCK